MEKEDFFIKRIQDLAALADRKSCTAFSDFLNLNEQNLFYQCIQKFSWIKGETFGGYEGAERRIGALIPREILWQESFSDTSLTSDSGVNYPISCVLLRPRAPKFAEKLSHRDILGALMHLGIERSMTGDIAVGDGEAHIFCADRFAGLICRELTQVRHTSVVCSCETEAFSYCPAFETVRGSIASVRLDAVMSLGFGASRSSLLSLIEGGRVFVNGKLITTNAYVLKEGDIVSARGLGRFRYVGLEGQSRKGRFFAEIQRYT